MGLITSERRAFLRRLKVEFDNAFAQVDPSMDRNESRYLHAEEAYKQWRRAIDRDSLDLFDDLDAAEEENVRLLDKVRELANSRSVGRPPTPMPDAEVEGLFEEMDRTMILLDAIGLSDPDDDEQASSKPTGIGRE